MQEANSRITRFILICNYVTRIINPLASRCAKFRFQSLPPSSMRERLTGIAKAEGCTVRDSQLDVVLNLAEGDMRRAVTTLQSLHALGGVTAGGDADDDDSNKEIIYELAGIPPASFVDKFFDALKVNKFDTMKNAVEDISAEGYSSQVLLSSLLQRIIISPDLNELSRARLAIRIAEAEKKMADGADEYLQLMTVCGLAMQCFQKSK